MAGQPPGRRGLRLLLVGAGGHARGVAEIAADNGHRLVAYADRPGALWPDLPRIADDEAPPPEVEGFVMGLGGADPAGLRRRLELYRGYAARGVVPVALVHSRAFVAAGAMVAEGATLLPGALVNPGATVGQAVSVNTGAVIEHDVQLDAGAHVAPGAVLLGGVRVGEAAMIGAGAVLLPGAEVPPGALVPALTRYPR